MTNRDLYGKVQILFPGWLDLADLVLAELELPTSTQQAGAQFRASYRATYAFLSGDVEATKAADTEANIYGDINPLRDFQLLSSKEPERTKAALQKVTTKHDNYLREFSIRFPKFADRVWQVFRRTGFMDSHLPHSAMTQTKENIEKYKKYKYVRVYETEEDFTEGYISGNRIHLPWSIREMLQVSSNYRFIEFDKDFMLGIGRYAFANKAGDIFQNIWDVSQEKVQFFNYRNDSIQQAPDSTQITTLK